MSGWKCSTAVQVWKASRRALLVLAMCSQADLLPEEQRSVLLLVGVEDLSYQETADVLRVPVGTVMSRLSRAREKMRQYLDRGRNPVLRRVK
jgi:RNA polymerase sigma factor (sigma-70 family)